MLGPGLLEGPFQGTLKADYPGDQVTDHVEIEYSLTPIEATPS